VGKRKREPKEREQKEKEQRDTNDTKYFYFGFLVMESVFIKRNIFFQQMYKFDSLSPIEAQEVALVCRAIFIGHILRSTLLGIVVKVALDATGFQPSPRRLCNNEIDDIVHLEEEPFLCRIVLVDKDISRSRGFHLLQVLVEECATIVRIL